MQIYYQGVDISNMVQATECTVRDTVGRCDSLDIRFANAGAWYRWAPAEDDQIVVADSGYDSGIMYVNQIMPENGAFRILASSLPCAARKKGYRSFINQTLENILRICAAESGMSYQLFGVAGSTVIPYIERDDESCAAFLDRLLTLEGAALKCVNGKYTAIGIEYAQDLDVVQALTVMADQNGIEYNRDGTALKSITVKSPYATATAEDTSVPDSHSRLTVCDLPVLNGPQAGRWARAKLRHVNQFCKAERLVVSSRYNPGLTALMRINVTGNTDATGEWLTELVSHDFVRRTTTAVMRRCIRTIR